MSIEYFSRKQELLISEVTTNYTRDRYLNYLKSDEKLIALVGSRGVGKTTLLLQYLKSCTLNYLYLSGDDIEFTNIKLYDLVDQFYSYNGRVLVIDEIHKYKNWSQELKNIYDSFPNLTIRVSGSSMLNILYEKYDLSRRLMIYELPTLSFREYLELNKGISFESYSLENILQNSSTLSKNLVFNHSDLYSEFHLYLKYGAYPFYLENIENFDKKLFNALDKVIYEDIPSLNKIDYSHISILKKIIYKVLSSQKPFQVNIASLSKEFGISEPTLYTYLEILDKTKIFKSLKKYSKKLSRKPQKLLFSNTNILNSYANEFSIDIDIGTLRETYFTNCFDNIYYSDIGDFIVEYKKDNKYIFEVGGKSKSFTQIKNLNNSYLAIDIDFSINDKKIPLWLFGFLY